MREPTRRFVSGFLSGTLVSVGIGLVLVYGLLGWFLHHIFIVGVRATLGLLWFLFPGSSYSSRRTFRYPFNPARSATLGRTTSFRDAVCAASSFAAGGFSLFRHLAGVTRRRYPLERLKSIRLCCGVLRSAFALCLNLRRLAPSSIQRPGILTIASGLSFALTTAPGKRGLR
jgi:hypothetical protein